MQLQPRSYQQAAHDAVIDWWRHSTTPCVVEAATGAGKSVIVAMIAETLHRLSGGKRVLCLQPSKELTEQNAEKFKQTGTPYSIYSASIGKSLRNQVIFATEGTFKKVAKRLGAEFAGVIIDECHRTTPTIQGIIADLKEGNPNLRVCGLSATPYRLGQGFIFAQDIDGKPLAEFQCRDPYFTRLVYYIGAPELIERGYLTKPVIGAINASQYDTSGLVIQPNGLFKQSTVDAAFEGWGRETAAIVADVVHQSQNRQGVMFFAATVKHAHEVMASLPPHLSAIVTGETPKAEREQIIKDFKARRFKYLVNVSVLTVGFDAPHVDVVAILRATESISLLQQIIGRGLRLCEGKTDALILDYAGNIDKHCPDGDLFRPEIKASYQSAKETCIEAECEHCGAVNTFSARKNDDGFDIDKQGYFVDLAGNRINTETREGKPPKFMPAHYGRRCMALMAPRFEQRCDYWWTFKECKICNHRNDIAARFCEHCKEELINPNDKLMTLHRAKKKDIRTDQTDQLITFNMIEGISRAGDRMITVEITTDYRKFSLYLLPDHQSTFVRQKALNFIAAVDEVPRTVTYKKSGDFWEVVAFNRKTDDEVLNEQLEECQD